MYLGSYNNRKLKVKLGALELSEKKESFFGTIYFVQRKSFKDLCFVSMYSALNTLSEYTDFSAYF